ncbi:fatty acid desaturase [Roseisolibacter sp. H3M3-2]|uniref:acyl-CoA desaturase n=1 Tax=Roseisolibacter sp. H3M3-2 TaxID=3031323 RepID=UPI0023D9B151|nr:fatty acid desaturase [Roseisolibacter sp. H3M3-2]MDF1503218.1 fatty acid desaturase [Roseisolibacter sp. H3M3-2]
MTEQHPHDAQAVEPHDDIIHPSPVAFLLVHAACLGAVWSGVTAGALWLCLALYVARMFGVTAGYHRYFSHRSFKTGRVFQFLLAFLAQSTAQRGILWWAAKHRHHHRHSDTEHDVHSPRHMGFWYSHVGWIFTAQHDATDFDAIPDLTKYPELMWLERHPYLPAATLALGCLALGGWPALFVGFFWSTVLLYHGTFFINSLAHVHGRQRYLTGDDSRNNWWLAVITLGEGWHNNHHAYQRSTRQGFRWYEFDPTFYVLTALSWARVVWDLGAPPADVVRNERPVGRAVVEKVARHLAESFPAAAIAERLRGSLDSLDHAVADAVADARHARDEAVAALTARLAELHLPHVPTLDELRDAARQRYAATPSLDAIVARARERLLEAVARELLAPLPA